MAFKRDANKCNQRLHVVKAINAKRENSVPSTGMDPTQVSRTRTIHVVKLITLAINGNWDSSELNTGIDINLLSKA